MTERITSRRNPLLEQVRRLDTAALRRKAIMPRTRLRPNGARTGAFPCTSGT